MKSNKWIKQMSRALFLIFAMAFAHSSYSAGMQKWVDENGKTHYGEQPPAQVSGTQVKTKVSVSGGGAAQTTPRVILYSTSWCGYCKRARAYMNQRGIKFRELDIETNKSAKRDYQRSGGRGVPFLVRGDQTLRGFAKGSYDRFFSLAVD